MDASDVTAANIASILRDPIRRASLLSTIRAERGTYLPLSNAVADAAPRCSASPRELEEVVEILLREDSEDHVLNWLVLHPNLSEHSLFQVLDAGRCIRQLGHRAGPEGLLLRIVTEHPDAYEAVLTLALVHYGPNVGRRERFLEFVRQHLHVSWLRDSLRKSDLATRIPESQRKTAIELVAAYERAL